MKEGFCQRPVWAGSEWGTFSFCICGPDCLGTRALSFICLESVPESPPGRPPVSRGLSRGGGHGGRASGLLE